MLKYMLLLVCFPQFLWAQAQFSSTLLNEEAPKELQTAFDTLLYLPRYAPKIGLQEGPVHLELGYGSDTIPNKPVLPLTADLIERIDLVYTSYPSNHDIWLYPYSKIMVDRVNHLLEWMPELNDATIEWRLVLQTDAKTTAGAKQLWHGWVLHSTAKTISQKLEPPSDQTGEPSEDTPRISLRYKAPQIPNLKELKEDLSTHLDSLQGDDPTTDIVTQVLKRHPHWEGATVVIDFTGSMYGYAKQLVLFALDNLEKGYIRNFVFFNDGDDFYQKNKEKVIGKTGGIYTLKAEKAADILALVKKVSASGDGGDLAENDIEALLKAYDTFDQPEDLILIADNYACIRDWELLGLLKNCRVHVILCGVERIGYVRPMYINLAHLTKGSLHLEEEDIYDLEQREFKIGDFKYRKTNNAGYVFRKEPYDFSLYKCH